jgi:hypothetical protein
MIEACHADNAWHAITHAEVIESQVILSFALSSYFCHIAVK